MATIGALTFPQMEASRLTRNTNADVIPVFEGLALIDKRP